MHRRRAAQDHPWDWIRPYEPEALAPKTPPAGGYRWEVLFVGVHSEAKGLGDLIRAIKLLHERGRQVRLTCMRPGEINRSEELAIANGLRDHVSFTGRVTHDEVFKRMRSSDLIVIPSRPKYPEGLPGTIYGAFASRTPLIASNHPMSRDAVVHERTGLIFKASSPNELANAAERLMSDGALYRRLSEASAAAYRAIVCPTRWADVIHRWLRDTPEDHL